MPLDSFRHYQDYIARLRQIPRAFDQVISVLSQGEKDGLMPSPDEIQALGLREVERITGLLTNLANKAGYKDLNSLRIAVNSDPKYAPGSGEFHQFVRAASRDSFSSKSTIRSSRT